MSEAISVHYMFSPGLSLEFSCLELVIQWTICRHIVGLVDAKIRASDQDLPVYQSNFKDLYSVDCLFYQGSEKTNSNNFLH